MATKKRLIDAKYLTSQMYLICEVCDTENIFIDAIIDEIDNASDVDAVEVVRDMWIPVSERLPGVFKAVIVWTKFQEIGEAHYNGKHFQWIDDEGDYDYAYVTHWMPLPEPPKEDYQ